MKFIRFSINNSEQLGAYTLDGERILSLSSFFKEPFTDFISLMTEVSDKDLMALREVLDNPEASLTYFLEKDVKILSPIKRPIHDIICVGVNYQEHLEETRRALNRTTYDHVPKTVYFSKRANEILGPDDRVNARFDLDDQVDYEVELAVIIGKGGKQIKREQAQDHIFGYSILNDLSSRIIQKERVQWYLGKSLDNYCAMGPVIVHQSRLPLPLELDIKSYVNGELRQNANTRQMIHNVASIIEDLSRYITLEPGDIIATGTPSGVGLGFTPPRFLKSGDAVTCEIAGIGSLTNYV